MSIRWNFKSYLASRHQIYTVTELQKRVVKKTGVIISLANLCKYVNSQPKLIRLSTVEIICTALGCDLADFFAVRPKKISLPARTRKLSHKNTPHSKIATKAFPEPENYE